MNSTFETLRDEYNRIQALSFGLSMISFDTETIAPPAAVEKTSRMVGTLSNEIYAITTGKTIADALTELSKPEVNATLSFNEKAIVKKMKKDADYMAKIPQDEYAAYSELLAKAGSIWARAKENNDFNAYAPTLQKVIEYNKKFATYTQKDGMGLYDTLLNQYEEGLTTKELDIFFSKIRTAVVPLLQKVVAGNDKVDKTYNSRFYPADKQREFARLLAEHIGFDFERGLMAESAHPFTQGMHNDDVRITNHFYENDLESAMFSVIHEGGHAIYEMGVSDEITQTPVGGGTSMGVHESQSRFYENILGRSEAFWKPLFGKLKDTYPEQLSDVDLHKFLLGINKAEPGPIRTLADELTYPLHIMVRYELEKEMIDGTVPIEVLPRLWNEKYEEYLGITPKNVQEGVLQDIHWALGSIGYFPSYAIGNAVASQLYATMSKEIDVEKCLESGDLNPIKTYLGKHIHIFGATKNMTELLQETTGEPLNVEYYIDYLEKKYTALYL